MKLKKEMMSSNWTLFLVMYKQMEISTRNVFVSQEINLNLIIDLGVISIRWELKQGIEWNCTWETYRVWRQDQTKKEEEEKGVQICSSGEWQHLRSRQREGSTPRRLRLENQKTNLASPWNAWKNHFNHQEFSELRI